MDWKTQEWSLTYLGQQVTLWGDPSLHKSNVSLKSLAVPKLVEIHESDLTEGSLSLSSLATMEMLPVVEVVLSEFPTIFDIHIELPPFRGLEHSISLKPGVSSIIVRSYRYPHATNVVLEKMVEVMLVTGIIRPSTSPFSS